MDRGLEEALLAEHRRGLPRRGGAGVRVGAGREEGRTTSGSALNTAPASGLWPRSLTRSTSAPRSASTATVSAWPW